VTAVSGDSDQTPAASSGDVTRFSRHLQDRGADYLIVGRPGAERVHVRFCGPFQGRPVVWDCEFLALAAASAQRQNSATGAAPTLRNFIDVGAAGEQGVRLRVGLGLTRIDTPAIEKMIIMIRNYKRLRPGRHEYGPPQGGFSRGA